MADYDLKPDLKRYLQAARDAMVWKLDGLSEYDVRRPMTQTGTNLLGLIKHLANAEAGYFGATFGRPFVAPIIVWDDDADPMADMWATLDETRDGIIAAYREACAHADVTIDGLALDALGRVPWWPEEVREATLHRLLVHMIAETNRHAGHADIVRELIDGAAGYRESRSNLPGYGGDDWAAYREKLEQIAHDVR